MKKKYLDIASLVQENFTIHGKPTTVTEISEILKIPRTTAFRRTKEAIAKGVIEYHRGFVLPPKEVFEWPYEACYEYYQDNKNVGSLRWAKSLTDKEMLQKVAIYIGIMVERRLSMDDLLCHVKQK